MEVLESLPNKQSIDEAILTTFDKVLILRFGELEDIQTMEIDRILEKSAPLLRKMAQIYTIEVSQCPEYVHYFEIEFIPTTIFFFNSNHLRIDFGTPDNTKFVGCFSDKQDLIDLVEVLFRGSVKGKKMFTSPIPKERIPHYELFYKGF